MHGEVCVSVHACTNDYLRCKKYEVNDCVHKHVIGCMEKHLPRFLILEALNFFSNISFVFINNTIMRTYS